MLMAYVLIDQELRLRKHVNVEFFLDLATAVTEQQHQACIGH